jgi:hypothetical protein
MGGGSMKVYKKGKREETEDDAYDITLIKSIF